MRKVRKRVLLLLAVLFWLGISSPTAGKAAAYEESFREGIRAGDLEKWGEAAERMAEAIAENPKESSQRIALSGVFSSPYLPHFFRGWFLYQQGPGHCAESLRSLEISRDQAVVANFKKEFGNLERVQENCGARVLPQAIETLEKRLADLDRQLEATLPQGAEPTAKQQRVREQLETVRASLKKGRQDFLLRPIDQAMAEAESIADMLAEIDRDKAIKSVEVLEVAGRDAERSLDLAERERLALVEDLASQGPGLRPMPKLRPEDVLERLETMGRALSAARRTSDLAAVLRLREEAEVLRSALEASRADMSKTLSPPPHTEPEASLGEAPRVVAPPVVTAEPARPTTITPEPKDGSPDRPDPNLVREARRLTESAETFLARIGADSEIELLELQRARLSNLILETKRGADGDATTGALEALLGRLSDSLSALQLIAGAQAYFAGNPQQAVELLNVSIPPDSSLGAHFHLFLSASYFALDQMGLLDVADRAANQARRCRELDPKLSPDPRTFSPSFREFFSQEVAR